LFTSGITDVDQVTAPRCHACKLEQTNTRRAALATVKRGNLTGEDAWKSQTSRTNTDGNVAWTYLSDDEKYAKFRKLKDEIDRLEASNRKLKRFDGLYIQHGGVNDDFKSVFESVDADPQLSSTIAQNTELKHWWSDQRRALSTQDMRGMRWNHSVLCVALSMYLRGPAGYDALKKSGVVSLPSGRLLQSYVRDRAPSVGCDEYQGKLLKDAYARHKLLCEVKAMAPAAAAAPVLSALTLTPRLHRPDFKSGVTRPPAGVGALMFDEFKISGGFAFKNNSELVGFACSAEDLVSLRDIYLDDSREKSDAETPCSYVLQFMWRDMTSRFDVIGHYWTSVGSFTGGGVNGCFWKALCWFSRYGFAVHEVLCDAASTNVKFIKLCCPHADLFTRPACLNPFTGKNMFFILDPEHMLKSLRNALFSSGSHELATRRFLFHGEDIAWSFVKDAYQRDLQRQARGDFRRCLEGSVVEAFLSLFVRPHGIF